MHINGIFFHFLVTNHNYNKTVSKTSIKNSLGKGRDRVRIVPFGWCVIQIQRLCVREIIGKEARYGQHTYHY